MKRTTCILTLTIILVGVLLPGLTTAINYMKDEDRTYDLNYRVKAKQLFRGVNACITASTNNNLGIDEVLKGTTWDMKVGNQNNLEDNFLVDALSNVDDSDDIDCKADSIIADALQFWGVSQGTDDFYDLICGEDWNSTTGGIFKVKYDSPAWGDERDGTCQELFDTGNTAVYRFETKGSAAGTALADFLERTVYEGTSLSPTAAFSASEYYALYIFMANSSHCRRGNNAAFVAADRVPAGSTGYESVQMIVLDPATQRYTTKEYKFYSDKEIDFAYLNGNGYSIYETECNEIDNYIGRADSEDVAGALGWANQILDEKLQIAISKCPAGMEYHNVFKSTLVDPGYGGDKIEKDSVVPYPNLSKITVTCINPETKETVEVDSDGVMSGGATGILEDQENGVEPDPCYEQSGALGWILCPIIDTLEGAMEWLYSWVEKNFLQVNATIFAEGSSTEENAVYQMWLTFQSIANVLFIILLLVVIFSQVTGVGIDNYGIKKILPKLIIGVILINLSYIICMLLVDLSNVLGWSIRGLLAGMGPAPVSSGTGTGQGAIVFGALGIGAVLFVISNPAILITFAVFLLSVVVAVLFMWIILVIRQAGVIIMVAIAPLAFACYLLPNTRKLFDRWVGIMKGLLLVFPLCSLVVGGGALASRVVAVAGQQAGNEHFVLAAMLLGVVPFFFVPTLLKGSLAGLGNIGAKLSSIGSGLGGKAKQGIKNTEGYKSAQMRGKATGAKVGNAMANRFGQGKIGGALFNRSGQQKRRARALSAELKQYGDQRAAENLLSEAGLSAARTAIDDDSSNKDISNKESFLQAQIDSGKIVPQNGESMDDALVRMMHGSGDKNTRFAIARHLSGYKSGVNALSSYVAGGYKDESGNTLSSVFANTKADPYARREFSTAMLDSKNFGNVGKFSPDLEEFTVNTSREDMADAGHGVSISASKLSTATSDSIERMWAASDGDEARRQQLISSMKQALDNPSLSGNIKGSEQATMERLLGRGSVGGGVEPEGDVLQVQNPAPPVVESPQTPESPKPPEQTGPKIQIENEGSFQEFMRDRHR